MNDATHIFIEDLKARSDVLGVILFGSWARGNNRPDSDVDLVVILTAGYKRTVEEKDDQVFEVIYTTSASAMEFWKENKDDAAGLWSVAKILYDKDGSVDKLRIQVEQMLKAGKDQVDEALLSQLRFDIEDQIYCAEVALKQDPVTAHMLLQGKVLRLTELFFDLRREWTPAPKQRMVEVRKLSPEFYLLLERFYVSELGFDDKVVIARSMVAIVFKENH
jgi:predicted nucleotidyltransferase